MYGIQSKVLTILAATPWYMRNENIRNDLNMRTIKEEIEIGT